MPVVLQFKTTNTVDEIADRKIYNGTFALLRSKLAE